MSLKISIIYGSTRDGRLGIRFAKYLQNEFSTRNIEAVLIDPLDMNINTSINELCNYESVFPKELETISKDKLLLSQNMTYLIGNYAFGSSKHNNFF